MDGPLYYTVALFLCMTGYHDFYYVRMYVYVKTNIDCALKMTANQYRRNAEQV